MVHTLVVFDDDTLVWPDSQAYTALTFERYLAEYPRKGEGRTRVINLCDTERYLSRGYYCSLLAEARRHQVLPGVRTINALREQGRDGGELLGFRLPENVTASIGADDELTVLCAFGACEDAQWLPLVRDVYARFPAPLLGISIRRDAQGVKHRVARLALSDLNQTEQEFAVAQLERFTTEGRRTANSRKQFRWTMAILVNGEEPNPPSDPRALKNFVQAASQAGIEAELVTAHQLDDIERFDALFIRETTAVDHHTYRIARRAEQGGLVVLDDTASILRCCNKVFLHDAFAYQGVPSLRTEVALDASEETCARLGENFGFPLVLKMPEGSFSRGVHRIEKVEDLPHALSQMLRDSALVLVQQYCYTDFDWRVGLLDGRALYACRYAMAHKHWQIYNHDAVGRRTSGGYQTVPTFELPKSVLKAALRAGAVVGNGLYGVDVKEHEGRAYVIEVNDNPSIESGVEDGYLGKELYMLIMAEFAARLEKRGKKA